MVIKYFLTFQNRTRGLIVANCILLLALKKDCLENTFIVFPFFSYFSSSFLKQELLKGFFVICDPLFCRSLQYVNIWCGARKKKHVVPSSTYSKTVNRIEAYFGYLQLNLCKLPYFNIFWEKAELK